MISTYVCITTLFHHFCDLFIISFPGYWRVIGLTWVHAYDKFEARKLPNFIWNNFYGCMTNEFHIGMTAKRRSAFPWEKWVGNDLKKCKRFISLFESCHHILFEYQSIFMKQKSYSIRVKIAIEYFNYCTGDHQSSNGGFIALIIVIA